MKKLNRKVLIVDDDVETRMMVRRVLRKLEEVDFLEAHNGAEAVQIAQRELPAIILMDILMPGIDGYEACRRIKNDPRSHHAIVIFMTAVSAEEIDDRIIKAGGDDLLRKPLSASELYFRVKNYLTLSHSAADLLWAFPFMERTQECGQSDSIDLGREFFYLISTKSLCRENHYIPPMKQEILLLEALLQHRNRVMTYEQLLLAIAKNEESTIGNLRTLVKLLRRKTYKELIRTLPSVGYRLVI